MSQSPNKIDPMYRCIPNTLPARQLRLALAKAAVGLTLGVACLSGISGCEAIGFMAESYKRGSTHEIKAEYTGMEGKSFAVVVTADRIIEADHPGIVDRLCTKITERLSNSGNVPRAGGFVPSVQVLRYLYDNPAWPAHSLSDLGKDLGGVERLIYIELNEYRLHDPGNPYEWDGVATGRVTVVELDGISPDTFAFEKTITVKYPDKKGADVNQLGGSAVTSALSLRFIDRASWLFYNHQEPYYPDY
jgi:hypothetical protein